MICFSAGESSSKYVSEFAFKFFLELGRLATGPTRSFKCTSIQFQQINLG